MKAYKVVMTNMAPALHGQETFGGNYNDFDELATAQSFAEEEKVKWQWVSVFKRTKEGTLDKIRYYQNNKECPV